MSIAHGGQVLVSAATAGVSTGHVLTALGTCQLRGFTDHTDILQLGAEQFPAVGDRGGNVPVSRTAIIGRDAEISSTTHLLDTSRLVTLTGPGGVGKTRLACEVASSLDHRFADGAWFVPLAPLSDPTRLLSAVLDAVGVGDGAGRSADVAIARWFGQREVLLVLDNCEHLIDDVAKLVDALLQIDSSSIILTTSQIPLLIDGERLQTVGPLSGDGAESAGVRLFVDRAKAARSGFELSVPDRAVVSEICERLDHIPLAIELAASRVRGMTVTEIAQGLDTRFSLLATKNRSAPERHKTMESAIRWSFDLLDDDQRTALMRLSVFAAPFTAAQAAEVIDPSASDFVEGVSNILQALVDRSLVVATETSGGMRFSVLESVKHLMQLELDASGDAGVTLGRYIDTFQELAFTMGEAMLGPDDQKAFEAIENDWHNIRVGIQHAAADRTSSRFEELFAVLAPAWTARGRAAEGSQWAEELLNRPVLDPHARAQALLPAAGVMNTRGFGDGLPFVEEAEQLWFDHGTAAPIGATANRALDALLRGDDAEALATCIDVIDQLEDVPAGSWNRFHAAANVLSVLGVLASDEEGLALFKAVYAQEIAHAEARGNRWHMATIRVTTAQIVHKLGYDDPRGHLHDVIAELEATGNLQSASHGLSSLAVFEMMSGDFPKAAAAQVRAIELSVDHAVGYLGHRFGLAAGILMGADPNSSARLLGAIERLRLETHYVGATRARDAEAFFTQVVTESLGDAFATEFAAGKQVSEREAVALALHALESLAATGDQGSPS